MKEPACWKKLGQQIHQDFGEKENPSEILTTILMSFARPDRNSLRLYIEHLISPGISEEERLDAWLSSGASLYPSQRQITDFLAHLLSLMRDIEPD